MNFDVNRNIHVITKMLIKQYAKLIGKRDRKVKSVLRETIAIMCVRFCEIEILNI